MFREAYVNSTGAHKLFASNYRDAGRNQKTKRILMFTFMLVLVSTTQREPE